MLEALDGKRKLISAGVIVAIGTTLVFFGHLDGPQWVELSKWALGLFVAGNAVEYLRK